MRPRIAVPQPHSQKPEYNERSLPQYTQAVEAAGGEAVVIPLDQPNAEIARLVTTCDAVLLPGSPADLSPEKYGAPKRPETSPSDPGRDNVDELLLQDAHNMYKPILGICYGIQSLNVWRTGTLFQDIPSEVHTQINHEAGKKVPRAHTVQVEPGSTLAQILAPVWPAEHGQTSGWVNSSHHQSVAAVGDGLRVVARCPDDGVVEAVEGTSPDHFVLGVQWHPERGFEHDPASRAIFRAFVEAARRRHAHPRTPAPDFETLPR
ncbi:MAG TPA: gamma-glutamyl-gamma-aminobutyrate hydrolase family protein [Terriglobales bacterium]|nr:gamma-glutamyl-gamma-aminobutyrate hydrolase family protein [Terriglobales bacterium]